MRIIKEYNLKHIKTEDKVRQKKGKNHFPDLLTTVFGEGVFVAVALRPGLGDTLLFVSLEDTLFLVFLACSSIHLSLRVC